MLPHLCIHLIPFLGVPPLPIPLHSPPHLSITSLQEVLDRLSLHSHSHSSCRPTPLQPPPLSPSPPHPPPLHFPSPHLQEVLETLPLNPSQRRAADAALDRRLTLVQGPPGTGKTATSVHILSLWVRQLQIKPVLACADSNVAVDNMAVALAAAGLAIVRAGRSDAIRSDL